MIFWIVNCSIAFLICVFCAGIIIPQILLIAFRKRLFDLPDEREDSSLCRAPVGRHRIQAGSVFHRSLVAGDQYG